MDSFLGKLKKYLFGDLTKQDILSTLILLLAIESIFLGALIPLQLISTGMNQFMIASHSPLAIVPITTFVYVAIGIVLFLIYQFACKEKGKTIFINVFTGVVIWTIFNYFIFGARFDVINPQLVYDGNKPVFTMRDYLVTGLILLLSIGIAFALSKFKKLRKDLLTIVLISILAFSFMKWNDISRTISPYVKSAEKSKLLDVKDVKPIYNFSTNKKNVVVVMLDRYVGKYFERVIANYPELKKQFDGFTFYPNTLSFGFQTTTGSPGLFGGYDYIPVESDKRDKENIVDKHNEAITTMPKIFGENDYDVVVSNLPDVNYGDPKRPNPFKGLKNVRVASYKGRVYDKTLDAGLENSVKSQTLHFIQYPFMVFVPIVFRDFVYNDGKYLLPSNFYAINYAFLLSMIDLKIMNNKTTASKTKNNQFIALNNSAPHEPHYLSYPDFEITYNPKDFADSSKISIFKEDDKNIIATYSDAEGNEAAVDWSKHLDDYAYYDTCVMVAKEVGKWLDHLRKLKVYDNSRIIIVADHGTPRYNWMRSFENKYDPEAKFGRKYGEKVGFSTLQYNPLLLVKDFDDKGFKVSGDFMTHADTVYLATKDLIDNPTNPYTGNAISDDYKDRNKFYVAGEMIPWEPTYHREDTRHETSNRNFMALEGKNIWDIFKWNLISAFKSPICEVHKNVVMRHKDTTSIEEMKCGRRNLIDYYECMDCGTLFYDAGAKEVIEDRSRVFEMVPHKFTNYVRNMDEDEDKHGTMTAFCDYGCGAKNTIGDPDALYHHEENIVLVHKNASLNEDGYDRNECSVCGKVLDTEWNVIPKLDNIELEYYSAEYDGNQKTPDVKVIDRTGAVIDKELYNLNYENYRNMGVADVNVLFRNPYEGEKKEYFAIVPPKVEILGVKFDENELEIEIEELKKKPDGYEIQASSSKNFANVVKYDGTIRKRKYIVVRDVNPSLKYFRVRPYQDIYVTLDDIGDNAKDSIKETIKTGRVYADWVEFEKE